jgi:photosystem II stability/assembly factor-like uncharacterized protein
MIKASCVAAAVLIALAALSTLQAEKKARWECHGPYGGLIWSIDVDETNPKRVLVWTTKGNFLSTNAGQSWKKIPLKPKEPFSVPRLYIFGGKFYYGDLNALYVSDDGVSWKMEVELGGEVLDLAREPGKTGRIWCLFLKNIIKEEGEEGWEVWVAKRNDKKWEATHVGNMPYEEPEQGEALPPRSMTNLLISPADKSAIRIFIPALIRKNGTRVFASDDGGKNWKGWNINSAPLTLAFSPDKPRVLYGAVRKEPGKISGLTVSKDGGKTWEVLGGDAKLGSLRSLLFQPGTGRLLIGTYGSGLLATKDFGKTLKQMDKGIFNKCISALAADPTDRNVLYAGTQYGLFKTTDGGENWKWTADGITACQITALFAHGDDPNKFSVTEFHQGIRTTEDGGMTWSAPNASDDGWKQIYQLLHAGNTALTATSDVRKHARCVSRDMGKTWHTIKDFDIKYYPVAVLSDSEMYAVREAKYLLRSADGLSWKTFAGPFEEIGQFIRWVGKPASKDYLLVVGDEFVYKINGKTGKRIDSVKVPENMRSLFWPFALDPSEPENLYAGTDKGQIIRYEAGSNKFTEVFPASSSNETIYVSSIVFDPVKKSRIIAGFSDGAIWTSEEPGKVWKTIEPKLPSAFVKTMLITGKRKLVVVGSGAVYTLDLSKLDE